MVKANGPSTMQPKAILCSSFEKINFHNVADATNSSFKHRQPNDAVQKYMNSGNPNGQKSGSLTHLKVKKTGSNK